MKYLSERADIQAVEQIPSTILPNNVPEVATSRAMSDNATCRVPSVPRAFAGNRGAGAPRHGMGDQWDCPAGHKDR